MFRVYVVLNKETEIQKKNKCVLCTISYVGEREFYI